MSVARVHRILLVCLVAALVGMFWRAHGERKRVAASDSRALALLFPDAALLVTVDLEALSQSPWGRSALDDVVKHASAARQGACAVRELRGLRRVALALPFSSPGRRSGIELAVVAEGPLDSKGTLECARRLVIERGGDPASNRIDDFEVLRDRRGSGELAVREGGPLIVSGGEYLRELLDRAVHGAPTTRDVGEQLHRALRDDIGSPPIVATWVLPPGWLERWLEDAELGRSPLGLIRAVAVRGDAGRELTVTIQVSTESAAATERLEPFLRRFATGAVSFLSGGTAPAPTVTRVGETIHVKLTSAGFDPERLLAAFALFGEAPSHPFDRANPEQVEPDAERSFGGGAQ